MLAVVALIAVAAPAWAAPAQAALRLEAEPAITDPAAATASRALFRAVSARLPPGMRERLGTVTVRWRDDLPTAVHGRASGNRIALRASLLRDWMHPPVDLAGRDRTRRGALAALLHELAHIYDRRVARLSSDPRLLDLAGWQVRPLRLGMRARRNDMRDRSPDRYELASPAEFVAVNLEHFLLDPDYRCRRPALWRHFAEHIGAEHVGMERVGKSMSSQDCAATLAFVSADGDAARAELLELDPARVYAVDYMYAEGNEQPMSRWGHAMLRLVVCAPGRPLGPGCRLDLRGHRVLSFRAFVGDVQISGWKGLTGSYPSRLFVLPLDQVIDEYTKIELRALRSLPLRLSREEIAGLLERAAQLHWSYDGRYYFVGNNCAVETWKLLAAGVPRLGALPLRSVTPNRLLRRLERAGVADPSVLDDRQAAVRNGYRFESLGAWFDAMYAVAQNALDLPARDARAWMALDPAARTPWLQRAGLRDGAALLLLEQAAQRREELQARDELKRRYLRPGVRRRREAGVASDLLQALLRDGVYAGRPAQLLADGADAGYGLPQAGERDRLRHAVPARGEAMRRLRDRLQLEARALLGPERQNRLETAAANIALLGDRLRRLAAADDVP